MKKAFASFGWVLLLLPFISFAGTKTILNTSSSKSMPAQDRKVSGFNAISSSGPFDVFVKMGGSESLRLEGDEDLYSNIETNVENGVLKIRFKNGFRLTGWWNKKVTVYITAKSLNSLSVSGSGDMEIAGTIKSENLQVRVSGSGSITFAALIRSFSAAVSGSGDIKATGSANAAEISVSGSGEFSGKDFKAADAAVKVSGSGEVSIHAEKSLDARVSGSGDIYYSGSPAVRQSKSGSGKISRI